MRSAAEVSSLPIQEPSTSIDPRRLQQPVPQHTYSSPFTYNESIDESFLASFHSMKHSSSSSPTAMDTPADYSDVTGQDDYIDFPTYGEDIIQQDMSTLRQGRAINIDIIPSIEAAMNQPTVPHPQHTGTAASPSPSHSSQQTCDHSSRSNAPTLTAQAPRAGSRPRTPQISISTDVGHSQMTPDMNSNYVPADDEEPAGSYSGPSPSVVLTMWEEPGHHLLTEANQYQSPMDGVAPNTLDSSYFSSQHSSSTAVPTSANNAVSDVDTESSGDEGSGRNDKVPRRRQSLPSETVKNFKDQDKEAEFESRLNEVTQWIAIGMGVDASGSPNTSSSTRPPPHASTTDPAYQADDEDDSDNIRPVSPTESFRVNKVVSGQNYINPGATIVTEDDLKLLAGVERHFRDAPAVLDRRPAVDHEMPQGRTAAQHMFRFNSLADNMSVLSRQATWGTSRRRSEPSMAEIESITSGGLFKRLSFGRNGEEKGGLIRKVGNFVRKNSNSNKLKRNRSDAGANQGSPLASEVQMSGGASLAPPRTPSANSRRSRSPGMPQIQTNVGDLLMPNNHPYHGRRKSTSGASPTASVVDFFRSRSRSRSDANMTSGIAQLMVAHGGPPIPILSPREDEHSNHSVSHDFSDADGEGDEEDEDELRVDDSLAPLFSLKVVPTKDGFADNIRTINPHVATYLCDRLAHDQSARYKGLLSLKKKHEAFSGTRACPSAPLCAHIGNPSQPISPRNKSGRGRVAHHDDGSDSNPENKLGPESFPPGIPLPPTDKFPSKLECPFCFKVKEFYKPSDWTKHMQEDISPFTCTWPGCKDAKSFKRKADYVRHENEKHRHLESWNCNLEGCNHVCYRKDNFQAHLVREHRMPEPKARSKAQIQKATGYDLQFWRIMDNCFRQSGAKAVDEPCKFCGQTFPTFKKLTGHQAKHMEQIALPIIKLIHNAQVDESTLISPVGPPPAPQPDTPIGTMPHSSPFSQGYSGNGMSPGDDMQLYPDPSPHSSMNHTPAMGGPQNGFGFQFPNQAVNYGMGNQMAGQRHGNMSPGTSSVSFESRYNSASPAQANMNCGNVNAMANQFSNIGMVNQTQYQNMGHRVSNSMSTSYGSSMADPTSSINMATTSAPYSSLSAAPMNIPMTTAAYSGSMGMGTSGPQDSLGMNNGRLFGEDPLFHMGPAPQPHNVIDPQLYGQYGSAMDMQRSHSDNTAGMYSAQQQQQQQQLLQQQYLAQQQLQVNANAMQQQHNLHAGNGNQANRARSASGGRAPGAGGLPYSSYGHRMN